MAPPLSKIEDAKTLVSPANEVVTSTQWTPLPTPGDVTLRPDVLYHQLVADRVLEIVNGAVGRAEANPDLDVAWPDADAAMVVIGGSSI